VRKVKAMRRILFVGNHALRSDEECDWARNIKEGAYQSFTFCEYNDQGKPIRRWKGIMRIEELFEVLLNAGLLKEEDISVNHH
jgi:hypothetical protein